MVNPKKAFLKFGRAFLTAPADAQLTVGLSWIEKKGWRVMMMVHTAVLHLDAKGARALAETYDKHHRLPEWRGKETGLEWVASDLRTLADETDTKNAAGIVPPEMLGHIAAHGHA